MYRLNIDAFMTSEQSAAAIHEGMGDILLVRSRLQLSEGGIEGAIGVYSSVDAMSPDLVVVEDESSEDVLREKLGAFADYVSPGTKVIVVGSVDRIDFYREMKEAGIGEYVISPLTVLSFMRAVRTVCGAEDGVERGRIISVLGSKGGVGASTVAHNLAYSLANQYGRPVSLVDMDLHFGTVGIDYNNESRNGFRDALAQSMHGGVIDEPLMDRLFTKVNKDLWLLASNPTLSDSSQIFIPESVQVVLETVARMSTFVVLDIPHMWVPAVGAAIDMSEEILLVSDASLSGLRNTQMMYETIATGKAQGTYLRYVVNGIGQSAANEVSTKDFSETVGTAALMSLPWNPTAFRGSAEAGRMLAQDKKNMKLAGIFDQAARSISGKHFGQEINTSNSKASGQGFLASLLSGMKKTKKS